MIYLTRLLILCLLPGLVALPATAQDELRPLSAENVVDMQQVGSVALSPDARRVAYLVDVPRTEDDEPGGSYRELWVRDLKKDKAKRYTDGAKNAERISSPVFTPDGKRIAFLTTRKNFNDKTQIYTIRVRGGEAQLLTEHEESVGAFKYSPDGSQIAFLSRDGQTEEEKADKKAGRDWKVHGEGEDVRVRWTRLWLFDVDKKQSRLLTEQDMQIRDLEWMPDGSGLVVRAAASTLMDADMLDSRLYAVDLESGDLRELAATPGKLGGFEVSPDGKKLAFLAAITRNDPIAQSVHVMTLPDRRPRNLSKDWEMSAARIEWWNDATLLVLSVDGSRHALDLVDVVSGDRTRLEWPELIVSDLQFDREADVLVAAAASAQHPRELFVGRANGSDLERASRHSDGQLEGVRLARQEIVSWEGPDGLNIEGILTYPLDYQEGERYPLVLQVHGGPEGVSLNGWNTRAGYPVQLLAADGFMVLEPNYRASMGRGVEFSKADHDDLGGKEFEDILAGIDALAERGLVDPDRVGTGGWSYGGYMSAWAATRWSERFKASIVAAGLTNWISFTNTSDIPHEMSIVHWNSYWFDETDLHWERSPLAHINKANTPTLLIHGMNDARVHPEQSLEMYTALRMKGVPTSLVEYPREGHGVSERAHSLDAIERAREWFAKYLKTPEIGEVKERRD